MGASRVRWSDASRGFIIIVIAIYHTSLKLAESRILSNVITDLVTSLIGIGMGLFFVISGMNSSKYIFGTWARAWRRRLGPLLWLMCVWTLIYWITRDSDHSDPTRLYSMKVSDLIYRFLTPSWGLWFLWSLILYIALSKVMENIRPCYVSAVSGAIAVLGLCTSDYHLRKYGLTIFANDYGLRSAASYYFFFYFGHRYNPQIEKFASLPLWPVAAATAVCGVIALEAEKMFEVLLIDAPLRAVALASGIGCAICLGRFLSNVRVLQNFGIATLPIYLLHPLVILVALSPITTRPDRLGVPSWLVSVMVGLSAVVLSLFIARGLMLLRLGWLFKPPASLVYFHDKALNIVSRTRVFRKRANIPDVRL